MQVDLIGASGQESNIVALSTLIHTAGRAPLSGAKAVGAFVQNRPRNPE